MSVCARCDCSIELIDGAYVVTGTDTSADGLSYCPPDPDADSIGNHVPVTEYPRRTADGRTVWACCESAIGPMCQHRAG